MRVTAVVVNWNGAEQLPGCLGSLAAQDHQALDVVVVDNASTDRSREVLARSGLEVVWNRENRGYAGGVNDGLRRTDAPAVLVCNPDVRLRSDHVRRLVARLATLPRCGAVQGKLVRPDGRLDSTGHVAFRNRLFGNRGGGEPDRGQYERAGEVFGVSGACALYRRAMLDDVGGPDETLFAFFEDVDLDWRARMRGWTAWYEPAAVAEHERGGAGPRRTGTVEELNFRNRLLVVAKNDDPVALLWALPGVLAATGLKALELLVRDPAALGRALAGLRLAGPVLGGRAAVHDHAPVPSAEVSRVWFGRDDLVARIRTATARPSPRRSVTPARWVAARSPRPSPARRSR